MARMWSQINLLFTVSDFRKELSELQLISLQFQELLRRTSDRLSLTSSVGRAQMGRRRRKLLRMQQAQIRPALRAQVVTES